HDRSGTRDEFRTHVAAVSCRIHRFLSGRHASVVPGRVCRKELSVHSLDTEPPVYQRQPREGRRRIMDSCDVLIVGGGPAGSSCAWGLRQSGLDTLVIDRCKFPRNKLCGGWITPLVLEALEISPEEYAPGRVLQAITGFRLGCVEEPQVDVRYGRTISYGIKRCEFDEYLLRRCGARIREGVSLNSLQRTDDGWIVNGDIQARLVVGAGGHFCPVSRFLGNKASSPSVVAQEIEFEMSAADAATCSIIGELPE